VKSKILVVDDVMSNLYTLMAVLEDDYELETATDGFKALELAAADDQPELIILDIIMPDMDGYEVCRRLKADENTKNIPVIFVTAEDSEDNEELGFSLGAVDYITKPIRPAVVKARVKTHLALKQYSDNLYTMAMQDSLTGLYNRHYLFGEEKRILSRVNRNAENLTIIMADIDHFKSINDTYGHKTGDDVLKAVANVFQENTRGGDIAARIGGEEFVILLDNCNKEKAASKAELFRAEIEKLEPNGIKVSSSFGVAILEEKQSSFDNILKIADDALYRAKEDGRNRVVVE